MVDQHLIAWIFTPCSDRHGALQQEQRCVHHWTRTPVSLPYNQTGGIQQSARAFVSRAPLFAGVSITNGIYTKRHCSDLDSIQKLLDFNTRTQILSRPTIFDHDKWTKNDATPPTLTKISHTFRTSGVDLAASACEKAMEEACLTPQEITHVVAVTCTGSGNPGYDLFVCEKLGLRPDVQRVLLQGVGCAGGLSSLRAAADTAAAASLKGRVARVLVVACELCTLFLRAEMQNLLQSEDGALRIAPALFSDAAAALVVCNGLALERDQVPVFELRECASMVAPGTAGFISYDVEKNGMFLGF